MQKPVSIAVVVNKFPALSETFIFNKVHGLVAAGFDVTVYSGSKGSDLNSYSEKMIGKDRVKVEYTLASHKPMGVFLSIVKLLFSHPAKSLHTLKNSYKLIDDKLLALKAFRLALPLVIGSHDLIHFEFSGLAIEYLDALPLLKPVKLITSCRGAAEQIAPVFNVTYRESLQRVFQDMDFVHCVSLDMQRTVTGFGLDVNKSIINYPSIDTDEFIKNKEHNTRKVGPFSIVSISRLHWKKGIEFSLLAIKILLDQGFDIDYRIVGGGSEEERLRFMAEDLGISERVQFLGYQSSSKVKEFLDDADVFLLPSLSEGLSNSLLEAMAMELPVVATNVGGIAEAVDDGVEGFLVRPYQPLEIAEKIVILLNDPGLRLSMGISGRKRVVSQFGLQNQINRFVELYNRVIEE